MERRWGAVAWHTWGAVRPGELLGWVFVGPLSVSIGLAFLCASRGAPAASDEEVVAAALRPVGEKQAPSPVKEG